MGIKGLMKLISDECPNAVKEHKMEHYNGRIIAIDASMAIYQFLIAIRRGGDGAAATMLTNEAGEVTSHIQGMFNRTIRMLSSGVKPVFVFDGKPPTLKGGELAKRRQKREEAEAALKTAKDEENIEEQERHMKRLVRASKKDSEDCKKLLRLMGVPYVDAPCEAEAQCAILAKGEKVHAVATEDMDALTFETPRLLRNVTMAGDNPIKEIDYKKVVEGLGLTRKQFIDLCILCGCDYCGSIRGIGPKSALSLIKKHGSIEKVLDAIKKSKFEIPPEWLPKRRVRKQKKEEDGDQKPPAAEGGDKKEAAPEKGTETTGVRTVAEAEGGKEPGEDVVVEEAEVPVEAQDEVEPEEEVVVDAEEGSASAQPSPNGAKAQVEKEEEDGEGEWEEVEQTPAYVLARALFESPEVEEAVAFNFKWTEPSEAELEDFLINQLGFNPDRVKSGIAKLKASRGAMQQKRLDSFFKSTGVSSSSAGVKRKEPETKGKGKGPAKKGGKRK